MNTSIKNLLLAGSLIMTAACAKQNAAEIKASGDNSAIVGGELVTTLDPISQSTVQLYAINSNRDALGVVNYSFSACTGTLLSSKVILTAAHCTKRNPGQIFVYFSANIPSDLVELFTSANPLLRQISGGFTGDNWVKLTGNEIKDWDDIALLKFDGGLPAGFATANMIPANVEIKNNDFVTLAGFGITDGTLGTDSEGLRKVDVVLTDSKYSSTEILVGDETGKGSCHGDSGGPAFLQVGASKYLVGVTSRSDVDKDPNGICTAGSVYTSVQAKLAWIQAGIKRLESVEYVAEPIAQPSMF